VRIRLDRFSFRSFVKNYAHTGVVSRCLLHALMSEVVETPRGRTLAMNSKSSCFVSFIANDPYKTPAFK